ncbi:hypothetical protein [Siphonobacter sp. SORGH_AS_1065]|uniref:hypothetical protein n=1 Tax=Siphonobacter sp. SORGH_AS_1065 TaxID=3041795 RepID=UPI00277D381B|nr:hypothetical protein [Siphonobacter sp. SORGH_AS_1065]MDQ1086491.1 hypothetical protein [Siphonobacter sp. SORGH_AS_1065]
MKDTVFSKKRMLGGVLLSSFLAVIVFACKDLKDIANLDPLEDVNFSINANPFTAPVMIRFVNANPTATNQPGAFDVSVSGTNADVVYMADGSKTFKASQGLLPLGMRSKVTPSASTPLKFTIHATVSGFSPVSYNVMLTDTSQSEIQIPLVELNNPAEGTSARVASTTVDGNGNTTAAVTIVTPKTAATADEATLTIASGTQMQDASGKALAAGQVRMEVVHYTTTSDQSLSSFPGGFVADNVLNASGQPMSPITFSTAGFISINMTSGGTSVKKFSKPVEVKMDLDETLTNPTTGEVIKAGDTVPLWSLNEETGQWKEEGTATIYADANGKLQAKFNITHLSSYNLDWYTSACVNHVLKVQFRFNSASSIGRYYYVVFRDRFGRFLTYQYVYVRDGEIASFYRHPTSPNLKIQVYDNYFSYGSAKVIGQTTVSNPCSSGTVTLTVTPPAPPEFVNVKLNFTATNTKSKYSYRPSGWIYFFRMGGSYWWEPGSYSYLYSYYGSGSTRVIKNGTYFVYAYFNRKWEYTLIKFDPSSLPQTINEQTLKGKASYNSATNTIDIALTAAIK